MTDHNIPIQTSNTKKFSFYENFDGHYHKINEIRDLIPQFKAFYYAEKSKEPGRSAIKIINDFNAQIAPLTFFPWEKQYRLWRKKWDTELLALEGYQEQQKEVRQLIKVRNEQNALVVPADETLEDGAKTLAGELLNDAMNILKKDQDEEELYEDDIIVKRRNYVLNVYNYITRSAHSKEALRLKSNADKRETMGFLMDLMSLATAGKMTDEDLALLKNSSKS
ncbi:MAG TPA: hypothetical protein P5056_03325 [Candidatus Paceibacterota bacterium]|nr:hypothetical protein [Candidatus Paceibacterota bacterium]